MTAYCNATHCYYCELPFSETVIKTREHIVPKSKGGKGGSNIIAACLYCNNQKGSLNLDTFFSEVLFKKENGLRFKRNFDIVLGNIAKLKYYLSGSVSLIEIHKNTHKGEPIKKEVTTQITKKKGYEPFCLTPEWVKKLSFENDASAIKFINTIKVIQQTNGRKLTHYEGFELYEKIIKGQKPSPNFHEEFVYEGIVL